MIYRFEVLGKPQGKGRPRLGRYGSTYTPTKTRNYEELVKWSFRNKYKKVSPSEKEINVTIVAIFEPPQSTSKKMKNFLISNEVGHTHKPDCDNIIKIILDSLNKVAYKDDNQVTKVFCKKQYGQENKVLVEIAEV